MENEEFIQKLKQLCLEYDSRAEFYPESSLEGFALYYFALHPEHDFGNHMTGIDYEHHEGGEEYRKELDKIWYSEKQEVQLSGYKACVKCNKCGAESELMSTSCVIVSIKCPQCDMVFKLIPDPNMFKK